MVELQLLTGMRPGEVFMMRTCDVDTTAGALWTYTPSTHKTQHQGHTRQILRPRLPAAGAAGAGEGGDTRGVGRPTDAGAEGDVAAVAYAHRFHPHQLRHSAATRLRKQYGLEAAQVILGHKVLTVTQVYAERNVEAGAAGDG